MTIATTATATPTADNGSSGGALYLESIPIVDLRLFSQSEIYALSLCSPSAFDPDRCDDVVIPKIDRSVFNESAGSRKQTYSRLRLAPPSSSPSAAARRRTTHLRGTLLDTGNNNPDLESGENEQMLTLFKKLFASNINLGDSFPVKIDHANPLPPQTSPVLSESDPVENSSGHKRKHGQVGVVDAVDANDNVDGFSLLNDELVTENLEGKDRGIVNRDDVAVDISTSIDIRYQKEVERRTKGISTVEELVAFLGGLKGRWDNGMKKKRTVKASEFGSALPTGWKLLLWIQKTKNNTAWVNCAGYISPSGRHFCSCKEAFSYLRTVTGTQDTHPSTIPQHNEIVGDGSTSIRVDIATDANIKEYPSSHTPLPASASTVSNQEKQAASVSQFLSDEHLGEILHCDKCNVTFCRIEESSHNRSSIHQRNKYKNVKPTTCSNGIKGLNDSSKSHDENMHVVTNSATEGPASIKGPEKNAVSKSHFAGKQLIVDTVDNTSNPASVIASLNEKERATEKNDSEVVGFEATKTNPGNSNNVPRGDSVLRSGDDNLFDGCFDVVQNPHVHSVNLTSKKAEGELFEATKRTNSRPDGPGRAEPVEQSLVGEQSSHSMPEGESKNLAEKKRRFKAKYRRYQ